MQNNLELVYKTPIDAHVVIPEVVCATSFGAFVTRVNVDPNYYGQRMHESGIGNREIRTTTLLVGSPCNSILSNESIKYDQKNYYCDLPKGATIKASVCYGRIHEFFVDGKEK